MIDDLKEKIKVLDTSIQELKNKRFKLNEQYVKEMHDECQRNVGRCFKNEDGFYYVILKTDNIQYTHFGATFNEFQYEALQFKYPYDNSNMPYVNKSVFINRLTQDNTYKEISFEDYVSKLLEVNEAWLSTLINK